ncbi:MAG TPA: primosomal protein N' [Azospirillaceae bacterium]|nr:primosomal protein N' [Azospirillaceae bacterium]
MADGDTKSAAPRASVLLPLPLSEPYDYKVPDGLDVKPGSYVEVPFGPRRMLGVVWGEGAGTLPEARLKPILQRFDAPPVPEVSRRFVEWVSAYTLAPLGQVSRMLLGATDALHPPKPVTAYRLSDRPLPPDLKLTDARRRVLDLLAGGQPPLTASELAAEAGCGTAVVRGLAEAGVLETVLLKPEMPGTAPDWSRPGPDLSGPQAAAAEELRRAVRAGTYATVVLDGVTGSGKTEVYFEAIAAALEAGRQVLVLLPEIALAGQWLERFMQRFGARPAEWHSDISGLVRRMTWRAVATGEAKLVVGARSALFLPYPNLGLIVVDEEHEAAFKQEDGVIYHARDMAVARAHLGRIPIVLVSATPSLETVANAEAGRYRRLHLPTRHGGATLPPVERVDLRREPPPRGRWLAPSMVGAVQATLQAGEQAMLFLNRRGYAPLTLCRACGFRIQCPNCTAWLVEHRLTRRLHCHHCDYQVAVPVECPNCAAEGSLVPCGPGVERVFEEVCQLFPDARAAIMASDTLAGPRAIRDLLERMRNRDIDLLVGTQVMAKGHHFPMLTLVGVVDADLGLAGGDLRAAERTYQLLHQVAGRAGRAERPGRVLLQTYMPEHPVMQALADGGRDEFLAREAEERRIAGMPPFGRLAALIVSGEDEAQVEEVSRALGRTAPRSEEVAVLGPAKAPLALLRGRHRRRLLLKARRGVQVQPLLARWLDQVPVPSSVRVQVDVDPYSFL